MQHSSPKPLDLFSYRPSWMLRKKIDQLLAETQRLYDLATGILNAHCSMADELAARGHSATANAYVELCTAFAEKHYDFISKIVVAYKTASNSALRALITEILAHNEELKCANPVAHWDHDPRHELALRAEIAAKVRRVTVLCEDIAHLFPSKVGCIVAARDIESLEEFTDIVGTCATLKHVPQIKRFKELEDFMRMLLVLDTRMHEFKRALKDMH